MRDSPKGQDLWSTQRGQEAMRSSQRARPETRDGVSLHKSYPIYTRILYEGTRKSALLLPEHFVLWNFFQTSCTHGKITFVWTEKNHKSISNIFHMKRSEMMENLPKVRLRFKDLRSSLFRKQLKSSGTSIT